MLGKLVKGSGNVLKMAKVSPQGLWPENPVGQSAPVHSAFQATPPYAATAVPTRAVTQSSKKKPAAAVRASAVRKHIMKRPSRR